MPPGTPGEAVLRGGAVDFIPSRSTMTRPFRGQSPTVPDSAFVDPTAVGIGKVTLGERVGVWPNTTIRGDVGEITIGDESNIQDNCCLHVDRGVPLVVGRRCVVGHSVTLHACEIEDGCLIGMGATVLSGSKIGAGSIIMPGVTIGAYAMLAAGPRLRQPLPG